MILGFAQGFFGYPFRKVIPLDNARFAPAEGFAYSVPLPLEYSPRGAQASSAKLYEDAKISQFYSHRAASVSAVGKGIFSFGRGGLLIFSSTDNSDPRANKRIYRIEVPHHLSKGVLPLCLIVTLGTALTLVLPANPRKIPLFLYLRARAVSGWIARIVGKCPAIVLSIPSIYMLSAYPPLWKDVDALGQLVAPASVINILHYPPLYCFLGRIPFLITSWLAGIGTDARLLSIFDEQGPSYQGIYLLVICQHIALVAALTYMVVSLTSNRALRCALALIVACFSALYTHAHCCGSEALSIPATFALLGAGVSIIRRASYSGFIVYGLASLTVIGSRHLNVIFLAWLPLTLVGIALIDKLPRFGANEKIRNWGKTAGTAFLIGSAIFLLNDWMAKSMIAAFHEEYRSTLGWTLSDRVQSFLVRMPPDERRQFARNLASQIADPLVRSAIEAHATVGSFYQGTDQVISEQLVQSGFAPEKIATERDRIILDATKSYLMTAHPALLRVIWDDFVRGFLHADNARIARTPFHENRYGAFDKMRHPETWTQLQAMASLEIQKSIVLCDGACRDPYVNMGRAIPLGALVVLAVLAGVAACRANGGLPKMVLLGWSALLIGIVTYFICMVGVFYGDRYVLPLLITTIFCLAASLASFCPDAPALDRRGRAGQSKILPHLHAMGSALGRKHT